MSIQRARLLRATILSVATATALTAPPVGAQAPRAADALRVGPAKGFLVAVGGAMHSPEIYRRFIELAGGPRAHIVLIPTAGEEEEYDGAYSGLDAWRENGARNLTLMHTRDPHVADSEEFVEPLKTADGVFFFGGRQFRLVDAYAGTKTEEELRKVLDRGGVIGGTSAGASVLASFLIRGDTQTNAIVMGDHQRGFGYLRNVAIDQHVLRRNRQFDLIDVIAAHPTLLGIGLDEDTAIVVQGDRFDVIGSSYALIYDNGATTGKAGRFYFLAPGDGYDMGSRRATRPSSATAPVPNVEERPWGGH